MPAGVLLTLLIVAGYLPIVLRGLCLAEGEGVIFYLPLRELVAEHWRAGRWPLWNPYTFGGMPLLADCQAGAFYPLNVLFLLLPSVQAMNVVMLATHATTAWGMLFLLREYRVGPGPALIGAVTVTFSGFMVAHMGHVTIVNAACWLPWLGWIAHRYCATRHAGWLALGAIVWAAQLLAGHPQVVVYSAITVGMMFVMLRVGRYGRTRERGCWLGLVGSLALGGVLAGAQILPTWELSRQTGRPLAAQRSVYGHYNLPVSHTPLLWFPQLFGAQAENPFSPVFWGEWNFVETAGYVGLLPWMLLPAVWCARSSGRFGRGWAVIGLAHLVLAWGPQTPVGRLLYYVPVYNSFEAPGRHLLGLALALGMCAAIGAQALIEADAARRRRLAAWGAGVLLALVVGIGLAVGWGYAFAQRYVESHGGVVSQWPTRSPIKGLPVGVLMPLLLAGLSALALVMWARRFTRRAWVALVAVFMADIGIATALNAWAWRHTDRYHIADPPSVVAESLAPSEANEPPPRYALFGPWSETYAINPQGNIRSRFASLHGYGPFQLRRYAELAGGMTHDGLLNDEALLQSAHRGLDLLAARFVFVQRDTKHATLIENNPRFGERFSFDQTHVFENGRAQPRAWIAYERVVLDDADEVVQSIEYGRLPDGRAFDPSRMVLVDQHDVSGNDESAAADPTPNVPNVGREQSIAWEAYDTDFLALRVTTDRPGWLVLSEPFYAGWRATVDGLDAPVLRANHALRAVPVPAGSHRVELAYCPTSLRAGLILSGLGACLLIVLLVSSLLDSPRISDPTTTLHKQRDDPA